MFLIGTDFKRIITIQLILMKGIINKLADKD